VSHRKVSLTNLCGQLIVTGALGGVQALDHSSLRSFDPRGLTKQSRARHAYDGGERYAVLEGEGLLHNELERITSHRASDRFGAGSDSYEREKLLRN
jgi:hypothetical protein